MDQVTGNPTPGSHPLTPAADMWAWACTVIHMATGAPPFANLGQMQVCNVVGMQQRSPPVPTHLPVELQGLLQHCLQVDRSLRPTAKEALQVRTCCQPASCKLGSCLPKALSVVTPASCGDSSKAGIIPDGPSKHHLTPMQIQS